MSYALVEKKNELAVHGLFDSKERAELFLSETVPLYVARGYYQDKTLRAEDFKIIEYVPRATRPRPCKVPRR